jgi:hypothetical protein
MRLTNNYMWQAGIEEYTNNFETGQEITRKFTKAKDEGYRNGVPACCLFSVLKRQANEHKFFSQLCVLSPPD